MRNVSSILIIEGTRMHRYEIFTHENLRSFSTISSFLCKNAGHVQFALECNLYGVVFPVIDTGITRCSSAGHSDKGFDHVQRSLIYNRLLVQM